MAASAALVAVSTCGRRVLAVLRGTVLEHDAASSGSALDGNSQPKALRIAQQDAGLTPSVIEIVDCHPTITGDSRHQSTISPLEQTAS